MSKKNDNEKVSLNRRLGTYAIAGLMAASCVMPTVAMAQSAVAAGLGDTDVVASAASGRSATVAKSAAAELLAGLGDAPEGKQWSWVCDVAAVTCDVTTYVTSDGQSFDTEVEAAQHVEDSKLTVSSHDEDVDVWQTSDGMSFDTEVEAAQHVEDSKLTVAESVEKVTVYVTTDGQSFETEEAAKTHAGLIAPTLSWSTVNTKISYVTSDGEEFSTYAEANQHVEDSKLTVSSTTVEGKTTWCIGSLSYDSYEDAVAACEQNKAVQDVSYVERHSADGLHTFESAEEAEQYVKDHTLTIAEKRTAAASTYVVNGNAFGTQEEADQYAQGFRLAVTEGTKVVHHDAVTHTEYVATYYVVDENDNVLVRGLTESEAVDYITNNDGAEGYAVDSSKAVEVVDTPASDETVAVWTTSDGQSFDTEAEAEAHASADVPEVTEEAHYITTYVTSDGQSFDTLELAQVHVEETKPSVVETTVHAYVTSDGQQFSDAEAAASHASALYADAVKAIASEKDADVTTYVTSDGQSFDTEAEANQHVEDSKLTVATKKVSQPLYVTSDGQQFSTEGDARNYIESKAAVSEEQVDGDVTYVTSDGQQFTTLEAAQAHIDDVTLDVSQEIQTVTTYVTSDGQSFETEEEANQHVEDSKLVVSERVSQLVVSEELGHYELGDVEAEATPSDGVAESPSTSQQAGDDGLVTAAGGPASELPNTGDASNLAGIAALMTGGITTLLAGTRRRR